jgi:preprotein translocase subunit SecG
MEEARTLLTVLMVFDAIIAIGLIAAVLGQEAKSAGMGGLDGGGDTVFSGKARGLDALLARVTVVLAILFAVITVVIAKMTM